LLEGAHGVEAGCRAIGVRRCFDTADAAAGLCLTGKINMSELAQSPAQQKQRHADSRPGFQGQFPIS
jgi:hypothetical protein